jgi:hypothetical protein
LDEIMGEGNGDSDGFASSSLKHAQIVKNKDSEILSLGNKLDHTESVKTKLEIDLKL